MFSWQISNLRVFIKYHDTGEEEEGKGGNSTFQSIKKSERKGNKGFAFYHFLLIPFDGFFM